MAIPSTEQKRVVLLAKYNGSERIKKMSDKQIHAVYTRLISAKKLETK